MIFIIGGTALTYYEKDVPIIEPLIIGPVPGIVVGISTGILIDGKCIAIEYTWNLLAVASIAGAAGSLFFGTAIIRILQFNRNKKDVRITYK